MQKKAKRRNMPKSDEALRDFFADNAVFADLFNTCVFGGRELLRKADLEGKDTMLSASVEEKGNAKKVRKYRDVVRKATVNAKYVILGVENQSKVHYAMPLRIMLYDALGYVEECKEIGGKQDIRQWTADEYLSKISKDTKLMPIFTLVLYTGEREWDGPKSLYDMLELDEELTPFVSDYHINVIDVGHDEEQNFQTAELRELFHALKSVYSGNGKSDREQISGKILSLVGILAGSYELYRIEEGEKVEMCKVLDEIKESGIQEGLKEGKIEGKAEGKAEGLGALVRSLRIFLPEFEALYQAIIQNVEYADVSREQVKALY